MTDHSHISPIESEKASHETVPASEADVRESRDEVLDVLDGPSDRPVPPASDDGDGEAPTQREHRDGRPDDAPPVLEGSGAAHPVTARRQRRWDDQPVVTLRSGATLPRLGLGTWQLEGDTARTAVATALELGIRHIDTAQMYGNEREVGAAIAASGVRRDDIFLTTKVANDRHQPQALVQSVHDSLDALQTDHVDLLLVHWPVDFDREAATADVMAQVHASGLAHHIGLSNFTISQLDTVAPFAPFEVLQAERHPFFPQQELVEWCRRERWAFTAYSPVARGKVLENDVLEAIARRHGVTPVQVALAWQLAEEGVVVIPRSTDRQHLQDNLDALEIRLDPADLDAIGTVRTDERLVDPDYAPW